MKQNRHAEKQAAKQERFVSVVINVALAQSSLILLELWMKSLDWVFFPFVKIGIVICPPDFGIV